MSPLTRLHAAALAGDTPRDWRAFYQAMAGTRFIVPLGTAGGLALAEAAGPPTARAFLSVEAFAATLSGAAPHAEIPGHDLARLLADNATALEIAEADASIPLAPDQLRWIADTYGAEVEHATGQGVRVAPPAPPADETMEVLGQSVWALGAACREAWLVALEAPDGNAETVLVLGLTAQARPMEERLAETVTRAVQAVSAAPFAVACPETDAPLLAEARAKGLAIAVAVAEASR